MNPGPSVVVIGLEVVVEVIGVVLLEALEVGVGFTAESAAPLAGVEDGGEDEVGAITTADLLAAAEVEIGAATILTATHVLDPPGAFKQVLQALIPPTE